MPFGQASKITAMGEILYLNESSLRDAFRIEYPYYGLFGSADIMPVENGDDIIFKCTLLNGTIIFIRKMAQAKWIDASLNRTTPLSDIIGRSIDDFLKALKK
jgi:hypothetical protein